MLKNISPIIKNLVWSFVLFITLSTPVTQAEQISLNFQNVDIRSVITAVSKATGKNFIIDPRVNGKVTLVSSSEVGPETLYDIFLSILKVHGFVAIPDADGNVIKIIPASESKTESSLSSAEVDNDDESSNEVTLRVIQINNANANEMIPILRPLVSKNGHLAAHQSSNIIIINDTVKNIEKLAKIIDRMDDVNEAMVKTIELQNASAADVVKTLRDVLQANPSKDGSKAKLSIVAEERTNSVMVSGSDSDIAKVEALLTDLDAPGLDQAGTAVVKLNYAEAKNIVDILQKMVSANQTGTAEGAPVKAGAIQVSVDEKANSVVIIGPPKNVESLRKMVNRLDVKRSQIMVEALIVEMTAEKSKQLGFQANAAKLVGDVAELSGGLGVFSAIGKVAQGVQLGKTFAYTALLEFLSNNADANLISAPSILTLENEEAEISVGREVPFITGSFTSTGTGTNNPQNPFTTIERKNVGLTLKITPQITKGDIIKLKIDQEFSNILPSAAQTAIGASDVVTSKRTIKTNALVKNGHMLVLGGLIDDSVRETGSGSSGLAHIPILGAFFGKKSATKEKRNLMVFITPHIIRTDEISDTVTKNKYNYMRDLQVQRDKKGVALMNNARQPVIKDQYGISDPRIVIVDEKKVSEAQKSLDEIFDIYDDM